MSHAKRLRKAKAMKKHIRYWSSKKQKRIAYSFGRREGGTE